MEHIYYCKLWSDGKIEEKLKFEKIYNGTIQEQMKIFKQFEENMKKREEFRNCSPSGLLVDPLSERQDFVNK